MTFICISCVKHPSLKRLVSNQGIENTKCDLCHATQKAIDADDNSFVQLFKALIRFHYNEWEYNPHWGGDGIDSLFYSENPILECREKIDEYGIESVIQSVTKNVYEDYDKGVTLFAGYYEDGSQAELLRSIKSEIHPTLKKIAKRLDVENYFNVESEMLDILTKYKGIIDTTIPEGSEFLRARIGIKGKKLFCGGWLETEYHYEPFIETDISAPTPHFAGAGRINRQGVSFFYAATNAETAIAEVRPHPSDMVSIGRFLTKKALLVADFTETRIEHFSDSDKLLDDFLIIHSINVYLNKVVPPSERVHYSVTQLIADTLRRMGYDGIIFPSTVGKGHNIVVFHPELCEYKQGEGKVFEIKSLDYEYIERIVVGETDDDYW